MSGGRLALRAALLLCLLAAPIAPAAADLVVSREALEDPSGQLAIDDVTGRAFERVGPVLAKGYSASAHWLRLRVRAPASGSAVVLRIPQNFLDEVRLFEPDAAAPQGWKTRVVGDRSAFDQRDRPSVMPGFVVNVTPPEGTYYLRVHTTSTSRISVDAVPLKQAEREERRLELLNAIYLAFMLCVLLLAIHDYALNREPVGGTFIVYQTVFILYCIAMLGYVPLVAPAAFPELADLAASVLLCGVAFALLLYSRALFRPYEPPRAVLVGLDVLLLAFPLQLAGMALGYTREVLAMNSALILLQRWYLVGAAFLLRKEQVPSRRLVQAVYLSTAVLLTALFVPNIGWTPLARFHLSDAFGLFTYGIITSSLFYALLYSRSLEHERRSRQGAVDLLVARKALEIEQALKEEAQMHARTDYLTGLFTRRHFVELAEREVARAARYAAPLSLLMLDIDHFKAINDTHGHSAGDAVLREVARRMRAAVREVDILGRVGGEEFAGVLIETEGEEALTIAERLKSAIGEAQIGLAAGGSLRVTVSIGLAQLDGRAIDLDALLREADWALYEAKKLGRNRVVREVPDGPPPDPASAKLPQFRTVNAPGATPACSRP